MEENEKPGPCLTKGCSWCCDPVKIPFTKNAPLSGKLPVSKQGVEIFEEIGEILAPEDDIEIVRIKTFNCKNFNKESGRCEGYENRPDICRNTSCIKPESKESIDEQHKKTVETKFVKIESGRMR